LWIGAYRGHVRPFGVDAPAGLLLGTFEALIAASLIGLLLDALQLLHGAFRERRPPGKPRRRHQRVRKS